ncbi:hypothetical protein G6F37_014276 [Rhizopus arrhizus]|nr:hypothetical protein G6F37_014276 [Rhizopus arrhizus]
MLSSSDSGVVERRRTDKLRITWVAPMMVESNSSIEEWMDGAAILGSREPDETAEVVIPEDSASEDKVETSDIRRALSG